MDDGSSRRRHAHVLIGTSGSFLVLGALCAVAAAQIPDVNVLEKPADSAPTAPPAAVHGCVRSTVSGDGIPHVLVVEIGSGTGVLTDSDGCFDFPEVSSGLAEFTARKPGFFDPNSEHEQTLRVTVRVSSHTPELNLQLSPTGQIDGQLVLATGEPAGGFRVHLLQRVVRYGRPEWMKAVTMVTDERGQFNFFDLSPGDYTLATRGQLENNFSLPGAALDTTRAIHRNGYPSVYYPAVRNLQSALIIHVGPGERLHAELNLPAEPFYPVTLPVLGPNGASFAPNLDSHAAHDHGPMSIEILDADYKLTAYLGRYDVDTNSVQADLPDGDFRMRVFVNEETAGKVAMGNSTSEYLMGFASFTVAGHAVHGSPLRLFAPVRRELTVRKPAGPDSHPYPYAAMGRVWMSPVSDPLRDDDDEIEATVESDAEHETRNLMFNPLSPQWLHVQTQEKFCLDRVVTNGSDLAREPIINNPNGPNSSIELIFGAGCSQLEVAVPRTALQAPVLTALYVWVVPESPSLEDVQPIVLDPSDESPTVTGVFAPGRYRVYTVPTSAHMPYRDPQAMEQIAGPPQIVELEPRGSIRLFVQAASERRGELQ